VLPVLLAMLVQLEPLAALAALAALVRRPKSIEEQGIIAVMGRLVMRQVITLSSAEPAMKNRLRNIPRAQHCVAEVVHRGG